MKNTVDINSKNIEELKDSIARNEVMLSAYEADLKSLQKLNDKAKEVAEAMVGLITGGDFVTGQTLIIDGGLGLS